MSWSVECFRTAEAFLAVAQAWLMTQEAEQNLLLSTALSLATDDHPFSDPVYYAVVRFERAIVGCALGPPPDGLDLGDLPASAAEQLVHSVARLHPRLPSVNGSREAAAAFAQAWVRARGGDFRVQYDGRLFRLDRLAMPKMPNGVLRHAEMADTALVVDWAQRYAASLDTHVDVTALFLRMQRRRMLFAWDDGGVKCLVGQSGTTPHGVRINAVYTPEEFRCRGYATAAVAQATARALSNGCKFCVLLAEPGPDRIYERLGYLPLRSHVLLELLPSSFELGSA